MGRPRIVECVECGRDVEECGPLSLTRRCRDCWSTAAEENMDELRGHRGPRFEHWRRRTLAAFGVTLPDEREADNV